MNVMVQKVLGLVETALVEKAEKEDAKDVAGIPE